MHWYNRVLGNQWHNTMEHSIYPGITHLQYLTVRVITRAGVMYILVHYSIDTHPDYSPVWLKEGANHYLSYTQ